MYEIELRALIDDFDQIKSKLDGFAIPVKSDEKEVTIFFSNPDKKEFDIRLKLRKDKHIISFKESMDKKARKEIESEVANPEAVYSLFLMAGFEIKLIIARTKYTYKFNKFEILLNKILNWGNAVEVEVMVENKQNVDLIESEIKEFFNSRLDLNKLLSKQELLKRNEKYSQNLNFNNIPFKNLLNYIDNPENNFLIKSEKL